MHSRGGTWELQPYESSGRRQRHSSSRHGGGGCCAAARRREASSPAAAARRPRLQAEPPPSRGDDSDTEEFLTPPSSPRAAAREPEPEPEPRAVIEPTSERRCTIPCPWAKVAAAKSADYHSRTAEPIGAYITRTPDNTDEHHTACNYVMRIPRPLRALKFPKTARWREEQTVDPLAQTLVERVHVLREGLDLGSSFGRWFAEVTCVDEYRARGDETEFHSSLCMRRPGFVPNFAFELCLKERNRICDGNLRKFMERIAGDGGDG